MPSLHVFCLLRKMPSLFQPSWTELCAPPHALTLGLHLLFCSPPIYSPNSALHHLPSPHALPLPLPALLPNLSLMGTGKVLGLVTTCPTKHAPLPAPIHHPKGRQENLLEGGLGCRQKTHALLCLTLHTHFPPHHHYLPKATPRLTALPCLCLYRRTTFTCPRRYHPRCVLTAKTKARRTCQQRCFPFRAFTTTPHGFTFSYHRWTRWNNDTPHAARRRHYTLPAPHEEGQDACACCY